MTHEGTRTGDLEVDASLVEFFTFLGFNDSTSNSAAKCCVANDIISVEHLLSCSEQDLGQMGLSIGIKRKILSHSQSSLSWNKFLSLNEGNFNAAKITEIQHEMDASIKPLDIQIAKAQKSLHKLEEKKRYLTDNIATIQEFLTIVDTIKKNPFEVPLVSHCSSKTNLTKTENENVKTVIKFYLIISSQNREKELVLHCGKALLDNIISPSKITSEIFLQLCTKKFLCQTLLKCNDKDLRSCFRDVLWGAMKNVIPKTGSFHVNDEEETGDVIYKNFHFTFLILYQDGLHFSIFRFLNGFELLMIFLNL